MGYIYKKFNNWIINSPFLNCIVNKIIAGVDEVGRGSLIGPVYAAAVILNKTINKKLLKDCKILTKHKRKELNKYIRKNSIWAIGQASIKTREGFLFNFSIALFIASKLACSMFIFSISLVDA